MRTLLWSSLFVALLAGYLGREWGATILALGFVGLLVCAIVIRERARP
jgi:hypothetical protein